MYAMMHPIKKSLFETDYIDKIREIDNSIEFEVKEEEESTYLSMSSYTQDELNDAQEGLSFKDAIYVLNSYYYINSGEILPRKNATISRIQFDKNNPPEEQRLLATELYLPGRGDLLRKASIVIDNKLFGKEEISEEEFEIFRKSFLDYYAYLLPVDFLKRFNEYFKDRLEEPVDVLSDDIYNILKNNQFVARNCKKYLFNSTYRNQFSIDLPKMATIIEALQIDPQDQSLSDNSTILNLLMAMVVGYDIHEFELNSQAYKDNKTVTQIDYNIKKAYKKSLKYLLSDNFLLSSEMGNLIGAHTNSEFGYYPLNGELVSALMQKLFGKIPDNNSDQILMSDKNLYDKVLRNDISDMLEMNHRYRMKISPTLFFKNLPPNEFLKWIGMEENVLESMVLVMGRNDITTIEMLHEVISDNSNSMLKELHPGVSDEQIAQFKQRLTNVRDNIFSPNEYTDIRGINTLIGSQSVDFKDKLSYIALAHRFGYYNHKQNAFDYYSKLLEYLTPEQIKNEGILLGFKLDYVLDSRCKDMDLQSAIKRLSKKGSEVIVNYKSSRNKDGQDDEGYGSPTELQ